MKQEKKNIRKKWKLGMLIKINKLVMKRERKKSIVESSWQQRKL